MDPASRFRICDLLVSQCIELFSILVLHCDYSSNILFMCAVGFVFSPLAPLVPLAAAIIFWINSFVYKYQLMFVFVTKVESGGVSNIFTILYTKLLSFLCVLQRLWNVVINRLLWCVVLMQLLMVLSTSHFMCSESLY